MLLLTIVHVFLISKPFGFLPSISFSELKAEAKVIEQMSSSDSSSESKSSSSSSSSENSSSDSEDDAKPSFPMSIPHLQPQPPTSAYSQQAFPDLDIGYNRSQEGTGHLMNTLRKYMCKQDILLDSRLRKPHGFRTVMSGSMSTGAFGLLTFWLDAKIKAVLTLCAL